MQERHMNHFLSMFHFQIIYTPGKDNVVADALSRRPHISNISVEYHEEFSDIVNQYVNDEDFGSIWKNLHNGGTHPNYTIAEGYLLMGNRICVTTPL